MVGAKGCFADLRASPALLVTIVPNAACPQPLPGPTPTRARGYDRLALGIVEPSREASFSVQYGYSKSPQASNPGGSNLSNFSRVLQVFYEWRDPDSNRVHHDFQSC